MVAQGNPNCHVVLPALPVMDSAGGVAALVAQLQGAGSCSGVPATTSAAWAGIYQDASQPANYYYIAEPNLLAGSRTTTIQIGDAVVTLTQRGMTSAGVTNEILNGDFSGDLSGWQTYATPDLNSIVSQVTNGVLEFYRVPPPPGESNQAVVLQGTGLSIGASEGLEAQFDLGNSSSVRKRMSVLMHDGDFSDLAVCTFWLAPNAGLATYTMRTHTTTAWTNATVSFYAATAGNDGGFYQLDNVVVHAAPGQAADHTDCIDPMAPVATGTGDGPELVVNGGFDSGTTAGWSLYGQLLSQVGSGVFEFYRPSVAPDPAGVILQPTGVSAAAGEILTAQLDLGNSSGVRKRVTILIHDLDFGDLSACTFWLPPGQPLSPYAMRTFTTKAWSNATISIYAATVGNDAWTRLDNVSLRKTPSSTTSGTDCVEPGGTLPAALAAGVSASAPAASDSAASAALGGTATMDTAALPWRPTSGFALIQAQASSGGPAWIVTGSETRQEALWWSQPIDLRETTLARLRFRSWLASRASAASVQVSQDGATWYALAVVPATDDWTLVEIDFSAFAGEIVWLRFVFDAVAPASPTTPPDEWWIDQIAMEIGAKRSGHFTRVK